MAPNCPVCAAPSRSTGISVDTDAHYAVMRCPRCRLAFTTPRPTPEQLTAYYGESYFGGGEEGSAFGYDDYEGESWASINASNSWDLLGSWAGSAKRRPGRLLDVGGATGEFAARATADGWDAVVCEVGESARAQASAKGLTTIATLDEAVGEFDLISMFHVLEHLIDPLADLHRLRELTSTEGHLVIEVPQWRSAGRIVRRGRWSQLKPPEHINFFTPRSLDHALRASGWRLLRASTPYPEARRLTREAITNRDPKSLVKQSVQWAAGTAGFGGYLRAVAAPA